MAMIKWKKQNILGSGSYGTVYLATPEGLTFPSEAAAAAAASIAAVKSADIQRASSLRKEAIFLDEFRGYPNIIECFGDDISKEGDKKVYNLLLEYAPCGSLHDLIKNHKGILPEPLVAIYTSMLLKGLSAIHEDKIVHCDIKPRNILVFPTCYKGVNQLKIADFGLAMKVSELAQLKGNTTNKNIRGTAFYASPESKVGVYGTGSDIWSLGCTVVEMITGERIWLSCNNVEELLSKIRFCKREKVSEFAEDFLKRSMERDVRKRWTADMLLNHPFIVENMKSFCKVFPCQVLSNRSHMNPFGTFGWFSSCDLFSTS